MNPTILTLCFLAFAVIMFVLEKIPLALTATILSVGLCLAGVLTPAEAFEGYVNSNVILCVGMFVVGQALFDTGMANKIGGLVTRFAKSERQLIIAIMLIVGLMSGFLSNTGTAAVLIPVVCGIADQSGYSPSSLHHRCGGKRGLLESPARPCHLRQGPQRHCNNTFGGAAVMVEMRNGKKVLITPITAEDLADIKIGDIVYLDGDLMTCRDVAHRRLVEGGRELPYDIRGKAIFHAGPIVRPVPGQEDAYEMVSVGPTTSMRMEKFEYEFTKRTGVRVIVGKGGMGPNTERACKEFGAIHCVFPAGCAVVAATEVERIAEHHWDELGMPETLWCCKVKEFGPLIVSIDAQGHNMFEENKVIFNQRKDAAVEEICKHVGFIK